MTTTSRIEDLRRRVDRDPASIAFAQLAEEHRRNTDFEEAVRVARAGLVHLPGYLSARVTLGRALLQLGEVDEARRELESVIATAPDNLAAVRTLAEIHQRTRVAGPPAAPVFPAADDALAGDLATSFAEGVEDGRLAPVGAEGAPARVDEATAFLAQLDQFATDDARTHAADAIVAAADRTEPTSSMEAPEAAALERWLAAIIADRTARG